MTYYIPLFFQFLRVRPFFLSCPPLPNNPQGDGPLEAGVRLLPFITSMVVFSMINGALKPRFGYITP